MDYSHNTNGIVPGGESREVDVSLRPLRRLPGFKSDEDLGPEGAEALVDEQPQEEAMRDLGRGAIVNTPADTGAAN